MEDLSASESNSPFSSRRNFLKFLAGVIVEFLFEGNGNKNKDNKENNWKAEITTKAINYLSSTLKNVTPEGIIIPSRAYPQCYLRDACYGALGLRDSNNYLNLLERNFHLFEENVEEGKEVPCVVNFTERKLGFNQDESPLLYLIWAGVLSQNGVEINREKMEKVYQWVKSKVKNGSYFSPPGDFHYWADTVKFDKEEVIAYNQGLYVIALEMLRRMGFFISEEEIIKAIENYQSFFEKGEACLGRYSQFADCLDISALFPEFLSRFLLEKPMLPDEVFLKVVANFLRKGVVKFSSGEIAGIKVISDENGRFLPPEWFSYSQELNEPGKYHNGGYWPMFTLIALSLAYKISSREELLKIIYQLMKVEFTSDNSSKEFLYLSPGKIGTFDPERNDYSWNALIYQALRWAGIISKFSKRTPPQF